jgi:ABC-type multidrug transport system ATPase subunit
VYVFLARFSRVQAPEGTTIIAEEEKHACESPPVAAATADLHSRDENYVAAPATPPHKDTIIVSIQDASSSKTIPPRGVTPVTLAFQDIWYTVPMKHIKEREKHLLHGVSGYCKPGTLTALMGSSSAGKTTLMDVIAGRKTGGSIQGQITLNGFPATPLAMSRVTGYCEQTDQHCESATFREALEFSAFLRQSSDVSDVQKRASVDECLTLLELHGVADTIIRGASVEQMKRFTIGVELVAQCSVLFLDEPTSGLDARVALRLMKGLRHIAAAGRTVVCTIHQPPSQVFEMFDSLLLLQRGGHTVFFGPLGSGSKHLITYLSGIPGTPAFKPGSNPATWMLDVIGAGTARANHQQHDASSLSSPTTHAHTASKDLNFHDLFQRSQYKIDMETVLTQALVTRDQTDMVYARKRAATGMVQMTYLLRQFWRTYWRTPSYTLTRSQVFIALAVLFGLVFAGSDYTTFNGVNGGVGIVFLSTLFLGVVSFNSILPVLFAERNSYYRERACQTYNSFWYFLATTIAEIPYVFGSVAIFTLVFYPAVGFTDVVSGMLYFFYLSLYVLMQVYFGEVLAFALPSIQVASIMGGLINAICFLFTGFNPPTSRIPSGLMWINTITPPKYALSLLVGATLGKCSLPSDVGSHVLAEVPPSLLSEFGATNVTVAQFLRQLYGFDEENRATDVAALILCVFVFRFVGALAMRYVNHTRR